MYIPKHRIAPCPAGNPSGTDQTQASDSLPAFRPFVMEDREWVTDLAEQFRPESCEYNFANLFAWQAVCRYTHTRYRGRLLVYDDISKSSFMPLGRQMSPEALARLSEIMLANGMGPDLSLCPAAFLAQNPSLEQWYRAEPRRDRGEYLYLAEKLAALKGTKLHKKRNLISQFQRRYPEYQVVPMAGDLRSRSFDLAAALMLKFAPVPQSLEDEFQALGVSFEHFDALGLEGLVLLVNDRVAAFSLFSRLNPDTMNIQFEKASPDFKGAAQVINRETARHLLARCRILNREQDLGVKGLRQAKLSYEPEQITQLYRLIYRHPV